MVNTNYCSFLFYVFILITSNAQAAYVVVDDATGNSSMSSALDMGSKFDLNADPNATNPWDYEGTKYFHASAEATTGTSGKDWYSFSTDKADTKAFFDIDFAKGGLRSWIDVFNANGVLIGFNGVGEIFDPGTEFPWDSFLAMTLPDPGKYFVSVGQYPGEGLAVGQGYTLHIGAASPLMGGQQLNTVPVPAGIWLFGSALLGLMLLVRSRFRPVSSNEEAFSTIYTLS